MMPHPRYIAEQKFQEASAHAALFELRVRLFAGSHPVIGIKPIDEKLASLIDTVIAARQAEGRPLAESDVEVLKKAREVRNKLLHCEFSSARKKLAGDDTSFRSGGVTLINVLDGSSGAQIFDQIEGFSRGENVGQVAVANTHVRKLCDVYSWLLEMQGAGEFDEAVGVFGAATKVIENLTEVPSPWNSKGT